MTYEASPAAGGQGDVSHMAEFHCEPAAEGGVAKQSLEIGSIATFEIASSARSAGLLAMTEK